MESIAALGLFLATFLLAAARGGIFYVFVANIAFSLLMPQQREVAGITLDSSDLMFFTIAAGCLLSSQFAGPLQNCSVPLSRLWVALGSLITLSYITTTSSLMTDPARATYQIYRYCWKPVLYFPLAAALIQDDTHRVRTIATAMVVVGAIACTLHLLGAEVAENFFQHKNVFGGALVTPAILAIALLLAQERLLSRFWPMIVAGLIWATLMLLGSRGAFVGASFGAALVVLALTRHTAGRARTTRLIAATALLSLTALTAFPQLLSSKGVTLLEEMTEGTRVHNLQWRMTERWPHYIAIIKANPWMGTGEAADKSFSKGSARGAHNGYLSIALLRGIPVSVLFFSIPLASAIRARRTFRGGALPGDTRVLVLAFGAGIAGIMVHNLVDHTVITSFTGPTFWSISGIAAAAGLNAKRKTGRTLTRTTPSRPRRTAAGIRQRPGPILHDRPVT